MDRRLINLLLAVLLFTLAACHHKKAPNPVAEVDSKQPDKVLFSRAMDAMNRNKFEDARVLLQTLINTYPDSEFLARAKLGVADSWYRAGGAANLTQAEAEYKDFITFFPNTPEAAEAQMKVGEIEYHQMERPDRDFTHAEKAEEEYRTLLQQYPDSKVVPEAKERLREVQEVLADREFQIGRFYYLRNSWPAAIARLQTLADAYPLFSGASEALFLEGDAYEKQAALMRNSKKKLPNENARLAKARLLKDLEDHAADTYGRIITRYPVSSQAAEARKRLEAMHRPVPRPTPEAIAQNQAEQQSRHSPKTAWEPSLKKVLRRRPDVSAAARVGDPTLVDPKQVSPVTIIRDMNDVYTGKPSGTGSNTVSIETAGPDAAPATQPTPGTSPGPANPSDSNAIRQLTPSNPAAEKEPANEALAPAPRQINQAAQNAGTGDAASSSSAGTSDTSGQNGDSSQSSSKQKKKKGLRKIVPF